MNQQQLGNIEPWKDEVHQIQSQLLNRRLKTSSSKRKYHRVPDMSRTSPNIVKKVKTQDIELVFKGPLNQARVITLDFNRQQIKKSNLRQVLLGSKRQQIHNISKKRSIKAMTITSIKKQLNDLKIGSQPKTNNFYSTKQQFSNKSTSKINQTMKTLPQGISLKSSSINISKVPLQKVQKPIVDHQFFNQIVNLAKKKNKIMNRSNKKSFNTEMKVERELFMKQNRKFKSWHQLNLRLTSSPINNNHAFSTIV